MNDTKINHVEPLQTTTSVPNSKRSEEIFILTNEDEKEVGLSEEALKESTEKNNCEPRKTSLPNTSVGTFANPKRDDHNARRKRPYNSANDEENFKRKAFRRNNFHHDDDFHRHGNPFRHNASYVKRNYREKHNGPVNRGKWYDNRKNFNRNRYLSHNQNF